MPSSLIFSEKYSSSISLCDIRICTIFYDATLDERNTLAIESRRTYIDDLRFCESTVIHLLCFYRESNECTQGRVRLEFDSLKIAELPQCKLVE